MRTHTRFRLYFLLLLPLGLLFSTGAYSQDTVGPQAVILQYHHVSAQTPASTSISAADFRVHMQFLKDNGFTILALESVLKALQDGTDLPNKSAVITFDDGYLSVYEAALPILREFDFPFTVFITSGLVSSNSRLYASWEQLREMGQAGATLANHSVTHPYFLEPLNGKRDAAWLEQVKQEIVSAEQEILEETGQSHKLLAYPYGEYNPEIQQLVRELGFIGIAQHSGPINASSDFTALPRFPFSGIYASMNTFPVKVNSLAFKVGLESPLTPLTNEKSPSAILHFEESYSLQSLNCFNNSAAMNLTVFDEQRVLIESKENNLSRRFRYNCTLSGPQGRFYWYSVPWVNPEINE